MGLRSSLGAVEKGIVNLESNLVKKMPLPISAQRDHTAQSFLFLDTYQSQPAFMYCFICEHAVRGCAFPGQGDLKQHLSDNHYMCSEFIFQQLAAEQQCLTTPTRKASVSVQVDTYPNESYLPHVLRLGILGLGMLVKTQSDHLGPSW